MARVYGRSSRVGLLFAADLLPVTYSQVWVFSVCTWIVAPVGWAVAGISVPHSNQPFALGIWTLAVLVGGLVGGLVAWTRPVATVRERRRPA